MLTLQRLLAMRSPLRMAAIAAVAALAFTTPAAAQTSSVCNPTTQSGCPADTALGSSVSVNFADGASDSFTAQGAPTYDSNGAVFTVAQSGQSPTLVSKWYIMFGKYSITMKSAPGTGIVSSVVLQSDDLDEIDWEWVGGANDQVQSNYFGKGQTTTYDRAAVHTVTNTQGDWHTYDVEWTENQIVWSIDGSTVRVLNAGDANGQYPQTPMQLKIGAWAGGDPSNTQGTIAWAGGAVNYAAGPFSMYVKSVSVVDYSTGSSYTYGDQSGTWESIHASGGSINGNSGGSVTVSNAPAITSTTSGNEVWSGSHDTAQVTYTTLPGLPSGWTISGSGKVVPSLATTTQSQSVSSLPPSSVSAAVASCRGSGYEVHTSYDQRASLTTATIRAGASIGWNDRGLPMKFYPSDCTIGKRTVYPGPLMENVAAATTTESGLVFLPTADSSSLITAHLQYTGDAPVRAISWFLVTCTVIFTLVTGL